MEVVTSNGCREGSMEMNRDVVALRSGSTRPGMHTREDLDSPSNCMVSTKQMIRPFNDSLCCMRTTVCRKKNRWKRSVRAMVVQWWHLAFLKNLKRSSSRLTGRCCCGSLANKGTELSSNLRCSDRNGWVSSHFIEGKAVGATKAVNE